jgi:fluoroquinolone transport system permease protein
MRTIEVIRSLGPIDARSVTRDSMLRWVMIIAPAMGLLWRFGVPLAAEVLHAKLGFDLVPYYPLIMSFLAVTTCAMVGTVIGFLLLDQRDDQTLSALLVTPLSLGDYLGYRLAVPMAVVVVLTAINFPLAGLTDLTVEQVLVTSLCGAPIAPMYALFIGGFASNKVQGFALAKAVGILFIPVIVAWFVPGPWQTLFGIVPLYWPLKVFWLFGDGASSAWVYAVAGVTYQAAVLWLLASRFARVVRR